MKFILLKHLSIFVYTKCNYQAEVIYMEQCFMFSGESLPKNLELAAWSRAVLKNKILLEPKNISERVNMLMNFHFYWPPWTKFVLRDILTDNSINFPRMVIAEDEIWTIKIVCLAENLLRIPDPLYVQRQNEFSMMNRKRTPEQEIIFRTNPLINGLECLEEFMSRLKFFKDNPTVRLQVLNFFTLSQIDNIKDTLNKSDPTALYEILLREFSKAGSSQPALIAYLLVMNNLYRNELLKK